MTCPQCGVLAREGDAFCAGCGQPLPVAAPLVGFSARIADPAYEKIRRQTMIAAGVWTGALMVLAVGWFTVAGANGWDNLENPAAIGYGFVVAGVFLAFGGGWMLKHGRSPGWEGVVVEKWVEEKRRNRGDAAYLVYVAAVRTDAGRTKKIRENTPLWFDYVRVGDRVRKHARLDGFEKYDKRGDSVIICAACRTVCDLARDTCPRCHVPLLK